MTGSTSVVCHGTTAAAGVSTIAVPAGVVLGVRTAHTHRALLQTPATATAADADLPHAAYRRQPRDLPPIPMSELHGDTHRPTIERARVPAQLPASEQGTGESFVPTLLRPVEWIRTEQPPLPTPLPWHPSAKRTGLLGTKLGMMQLWDHHGVRIPITVVKIDSQVVGVNNVMSPKKRTLGLQMGIGTRKLKNTPKAQMVVFAKNGVAPKRRIVEFAVTPDAMLPIGWTANVRHFVPGQLLDVTGTSTGKGFQGGMKKCQTTRTRARADSWPTSRWRAGARWTQWTHARVLIWCVLCVLAVFLSPLLLLLPLCLMGRRLQGTSAV